MKRTALYVLAILLALSSCSSEDDFNDYEIFEEHFEEWGITVPYFDVSQSETYKYLEALIDYVDKNQIYTINFPTSNLNYPSVTKFNEFLRNSKEAADFFKRRDCVSVLLSAYLINLKTVRGYGDNYNFKFFLEFVLSSDMCISKMNETEKVQLMVLALESDKIIMMGIDGIDVEFTVKNWNIMISIMLSSNYTPFINDIKPMLREAAMGATYWLETNGGSLMPNQINDMIIGYAKQFINDNKKIIL